MKHKHKKRRWKRWLALGLAAYAAFALLSCTLPYVKPPAVSEEAAHRLSTAQYTAATTGPDRALLVESTDNAFNLRVELLREARETLDIVYHTIQYGESTEAFFGEVVLAADRGVQVHIIMDGKAGALTANARNILKALAGHENIELRYYNPVNLLHPLGWNSILHDKFIIADGEYLLLGGRNIGDTYFAPDNYTGNVTNDRDVLVWNTQSGTGESVILQAAAYMQLVWGDANTKPCTPLSARKLPDALQTLRNAAQQFPHTNQRFYSYTLEEYLAQTVETNTVNLIYNPLNTSAKEPWVGYAIQQLMLSAQQEVLIQTPYATANSHFLQALENTAQTVPLILLTNSMASSPNYPAYSNYNANRAKFIATGAQIYEYQSENSIHGKSVLIDGRISVVGSFNMDDRSLAVDTETMLVVDSEAFAVQLAAAMEGYIGEALPVQHDGSYALNGTVEALPVALGKRLGMWAFTLISRPFQYLI